MNQNGRPETNMHSHGLYQIYDKVAETSLGPVLKAHKAAAAVREFHTALGDNRTSLNQHPADYNLLYVGEQDDQTGQIQGTKPMVVATGAQWVETQPQPADTT